MLQEKLSEMGLALPTLPAAAASYVGFKVIGNQVVVSGQLPLLDGRPVLTGKLAAEADIGKAYVAAQHCALNVLAQLNVAIGGDWSRFVQVVRLGGFVACTPSFIDAPKVVNGASDLMTRLFGDAGAHARAAVGVASLPLDVSVEIEATFEIRG